MAPISTFLSFIITTISSIYHFASQHLLHIAYNPLPNTPISRHTELPIPMPSEPITSKSADLILLQTRHIPLHNSQRTESTVFSQQKTKYVTNYSFVNPILPNPQSQRSKSANSHKYKGPNTEDREMHLWPSVKLRDSFKLEYLNNLEWNLKRLRSDKKKKKKNQTSESSNQESLLSDNDDDDREDNKDGCCGCASDVVRDFAMMFSCWCCCYCCGGKRLPVWKQVFQQSSELKLMPIPMLKSSCQSNLAPYGTLTLTTSSTDSQTRQ
ncbi:hypothetical protein OSB04_026589 [Centaurea solstitialis]|uniref:Uncharacterized protein n=1 Tax=Centaurea solstitialis TaxID=347529 RepID=A0AA38SX77_9ASTR|nr:hypothetical protein OSB04_026589 [Centaurea solstitialis]